LRGRFAPSPTGPLHFGSLVAAVGSYLEARRSGGEWLIRIEDVDRQRCKAEWADDILRTLEVFRFEWDGEPIYQSRRGAFYQEALDQLAKLKVIYPCGCTRKEIADSSVQGIEGTVYPGTCRKNPPTGRSFHALRLHTNDVEISFTDAIHGEIHQNVESAIGDFVIKRADGPIAYQLAVVVDDSEQGITQVVRGADLLLSTPRQIYLQHLLELPTLQYAHLPVAVNTLGEKLSKQTGAYPVETTSAAETLAQALAFLNHPPPPRLSLDELWHWALESWNLAKVPRQIRTRSAETHLYFHSRVSS
jgi:glutamyl-Q tRNA(Asp) synthetase